LSVCPETALVRHAGLEELAPCLTQGIQTFLKKDWIPGRASLARNDNPTPENVKLRGPWIEPRFAEM
jgi:hypothetical protein